MIDKILALDLGRCTGWAVGEPGGVPLYGSTSFGSDGSSYGAIGSKFGEWLRDMILVHRPTLCVMEAPLVPQAQTNITSARILFGLAWQVEHVCYDSGLYNVREAMVQKVRAFFVAHGRLSSEAAEAAVRRKCRSLGWSPQDHNAADALALWSYQCAIVAPGLELKRHTA